ncbi:MAG TPA: DUF1684 domain-containing protein [Solirubrobacteraceae bacterium]|jgi:uncharacterized protein (DUF1684 family)|nr:DUF1684 domain-containing protein [Solirubrobacteraceae bacterium]
MSGDAVDEALALLDWRRQIAELYAFIRTAADPHHAWTVWLQTRSRLFRGHRQSPIPPAERPAYAGPHVYAYDPAWRALAEVQPASPARLELPTSRGEVMTASRFARAHFTAAGTDLALDLYLLEGYGGGLFLPFADATSGQESYGAGRYLLDTVKGADLGLRDGRLVLDFNFAYQPSCSYDPRWMCPLTPAANRLPVPVRAGERLGPS